MSWTVIEETPSGRYVAEIDPTWQPPMSMPFVGSIWTTPLPDNAQIDTGSPAVVSELVGQIGASRPNLNVKGWTAENIIVPNSQPFVPVQCSGGTADLRAVLALGVPIPPGTRPTTLGGDTDQTLTIWMPNYVNPLMPSWGIVGVYFELYKANPNVDANGLEHWTCTYGARFVNVNTSDRGHNVTWVGGPGGKNYATDPNSTYSQAVWGVQGSHLPYMAGVMNLADVRRGYADHALLFESLRTLSGNHWWPATGSDGNTNGSKLIEGMRFRLPAGFPIPTNVHPLCQIAIRAARDYGLVLTDQSGSVAMRAAPSVEAAGHVGNVPTWTVLDGFPWSSLQVIAQGSDSLHTPLA